MPPANLPHWTRHPREKADPLSALHILHWKRCPYGRYSGDPKKEWRVFHAAALEKLGAFTDLGQNLGQSPFCERLDKCVEEAIEEMEKFAAAMPAGEGLLDRDTAEYQHHAKLFSGSRFRILQLLSNAKYLSSRLEPLKLPVKLIMCDPWKICDNLAQYRAMLVSRLIWLKGPGASAAARVPYGSSPRYEAEDLVFDFEGKIHHNVISPDMRWLLQDSEIPNLEWLNFIRLAGRHTCWEVFGRSVLDALLTCAFATDVTANMRVYEFSDPNKLWTRKYTSEAFQMRRLQVNGACVAMVTDPGQAADQPPEGHCEICLQSFLDISNHPSGITATTRCGHTFGSECLQNWMSTTVWKHTCPKCRGRLCLVSYAYLMPEPEQRAANLWLEGVDDANLDLEIDEFLLNAGDACPGEIFPSEAGELFRRLSEQEKSLNQAWKLIFGWASNRVQNMYLHEVGEDSDSRDSSE